MREKAAFVVLRMVTGLIFFAHGLQKLQKGLGVVAEWFGSVGLPTWLAYLVTLAELLGGMALVIGLAVRPASLLLAVIMVGAIVTVKWSNGLIGANGAGGYELDLILLAVTMYLAVTQREDQGGKPCDPRFRLKNR
ncbi:putative membrane protein YphA (DoxX/SURF4 family) [Brevibacillus aydinogluensis]|jgi:putative oxidoreductase|uniref:DoxX family protein n=1 Tax=Brevibacillus TaxID=55080 RepID=UPI001B8F81CC|nr:MULTISPECIES: DoxX family protein [Brevibacillus]MBR8661581.1 DoxX family protein [Brevibacillus sp. NL20B1]MDT3417934.1 putative membrane protein YphA (DoxX/SURF4 family) [Brevibacillus aydinogluensis]